MLLIFKDLESYLRSFELFFVIPHLMRNPEAMMRIIFLDSRFHGNDNHWNRVRYESRRKKHLDNTYYLSNNVD